MNAFEADWLQQLLKSLASGDIAVVNYTGTCDGKPISVVEFGSSMTAGPTISLPAASAGRHTMRASSGR